MKNLTSLAIVDVMFGEDDRATATALINHALGEARRESADVCACMLNELSPYYPTLKRHGFLRTPETFTLILHEPPASPHRLSEAPPADWHLTWFDHDFV